MARANAIADPAERGLGDPDAAADDYEALNPRELEVTADTSTGNDTLLAAYQHDDSNEQLEAAFSDLAQVMGAADAQYTGERIAAIERCAQDIAHAIANCRDDASVQEAAERLGQALTAADYAAHHAEQQIQAHTVDELKQALRVEFNVNAGVSANGDGWQAHIDGIYAGEVHDTPASAMQSALDHLRQEAGISEAAVNAPAESRSERAARYHGAYLEAHYPDRWAINKAFIDDVNKMYEANRPSLNNEFTGRSEQLQREYRSLITNTEAMIDNTINRFVGATGYDDGLTETQQGRQAERYANRLAGMYETMQGMVEQIAAAKYDHAAQLEAIVAARKYLYNEERRIVGRNQTVLRPV